MTIKWEFSKRRNRQNVKNHENHKKSLQKRQFADFFSKFSRKSQPGLAFDKFRCASEAHRCKISKKIDFLSAVLSKDVTN